MNYTPVINVPNPKVTKTQITNENAIPYAVPFGAIPPGAQPMMPPIMGPGPINPNRRPVMRSNVSDLDVMYPTDDPTDITEKYEYIPLYKLSRQLIDACIQIIAKLPNYSKYIQKEYLYKYIHHIQFYIIKSYEETELENKVKLLNRAKDVAIHADIELKVCYNFNTIPKKLYINAVTILFKLKRQLEKWQESVLKQIKEIETNNNIC